MNSNGWCGVCLKDAKPFSYGYCAFDEPPSTNEFITRVKVDKNWGFCSDQCNQISQTQQLKEAKLTVLPFEDCVRFNSTTLGYRGDGELCAGNKKPFPIIKVYTRKNKRRGSKKHNFVFTKLGINTVRGHQFLLREGIVNKTFLFQARHNFSVTNEGSAKTGGRTL